jgi:phenylalanyl-tRNA synthetase beta chain
VKGVVEALYAALKAEPAFERAEHALFHPGKTARTRAGVLGELHPRLLEGEWGVFELDLEELFAASHEPVIYEDFITYPAIRQDIAVSVPEDVPVGDLVAAAHGAAGPELVEARVFDVYRGEQVGAGRKSVAIAVAFQSHERTLADEDATRLRDAITAELGRRFGAELRT